MTPELSVRFLADQLQFVQFLAYAVTTNMQTGLPSALGPRDELVRFIDAAAWPKRIPSSPERMAWTS